MRLPYDDLSTRVEYSTGRVLSRSLEAFPASNAKLTRRAMFRFAAQLAPGLLMAARDDSSTLLPPRSSSDVRRMARFPEKRELILQTDRPPPLETPLHHFRQDVPPNEAFFVRWHVAGIPTHVDTGVFRLQVDGHVQPSLSLSLDELRRRFESVSVIAIAQCSGQLAQPVRATRFGRAVASGSHGQRAADGSPAARDLPEAAGIRAGAVDVSFDALDEPSLASIPDVVKSLAVDRAREPDVMVAYEMNGEPLATDACIREPL
jgi:sulfite dehydrogenase (cytochrome) subunit A